MKNSYLYFVRVFAEIAVNLVERSSLNIYHHVLPLGWKNLQVTALTSADFQQENKDDVLQIYLFRCIRGRASRDIAIFFFKYIFYLLKLKLMLMLENMLLKHRCRRKLNFLLNNSGCNAQSKSKKYFISQITYILISIVCYENVSVQCTYIGAYTYT
jgi:hypothetical protein